MTSGRQVRPTPRPCIGSPVRGSAPTVRTGEGRKMSRLRCMSAVFTVLIGIWGEASAQTTSTSTSITTSTTTTSTTTIVSTTTTTTTANPCGGELCIDEPPAAVLSASSGQVDAHRTSHCWRGPADPFTRCVTPGLLPDYTPPTLVVTQGEVVTVTFAAPRQVIPNEVTLRTAAQDVSLVAANPTQFDVNLPPGTYRLVEGLRTAWLQGTVRYSFGLEVRAPAAPTAPTTTTGRLALTG